MSMAGAGRVGTVQLPLGQLAAIGFGALCVMNPEKVLNVLHKSTQVFLLPTNSHPGQQQQAAPIVIHSALPQTSSSSTTSKSVVVTVVQLLVGAGFCWGTYVVLLKTLPEAMTGMMPVSKNRFNQAVTSLGRAIMNIKDSLGKQISSLLQKQEELGEQQQETHDEVLSVKDSVVDLKDDLTLIQESLNLCHSTLSESDRRTAYIAHGVQLLTRGVSTFLPADDALLGELVKFNSTGDEFKNPAKLLQLRQLLRSLQKTKEQEVAAASTTMTMTDVISSGSMTMPQAVLLEATTTSGSNSNSSSNDPENEIPKMPTSSSSAAVDRNVMGEVQALVESCM